MWPPSTLAHCPCPCCAAAAAAAAAAAEAEAAEAAGPALLGIVETSSMQYAVLGCDCRRLLHLVGRRGKFAAIWKVPDFLVFAGVMLTTLLPFSVYLFHEVDGG